MDPNSFPGWAVWIAIGIATAAVEVLSPVFGFIFISVAVLPAALAAALDAPLAVQLVAFVVTLVLLLVFVRPRLIAKVAPAPGLPPGSAALVGHRARVTEAVDPVTGTGRVTVAGADWAARAADPITVGTEVVVRAQDGVVLVVETHRS